MRKAAVAGQFYPFEGEEIKKEVKKYMAEARTFSGNIIAGIAPHAGYIYSGKTAGYLYKSLEGKKYSTVVIIGPNHTGLGPGISIYPGGGWETPLGAARVDEKLAGKINFEETMLDETAHTYEHSVEVQIPFLQIALQNPKIIPICVLDQRKEEMVKLGKRLAETLGRGDLVIASTDFSHHVSYKTAYANDMLAIAKIKKLDVDGLYDVVEKENISMCGFGPVAAAIAFARARGAKKGELLHYSTSGDVTGDFSGVVGYGAIALGD